MSKLYEKIPFQNLEGGVWRQGWEIKVDINDWKDRDLEVVIVFHSHHDPGWKKTFNGYLNDEVTGALSAALNFLGKNPIAKFIYAEVSYLDGWWQTLSNSEKTAFTKLVRDGSWEIATGGWVMNDEATVHYGATLAQLTEGQHWLMDNIGFFPNTSWAIDPFGYSQTEAYLLRKSGIQHMLIQRTHYEVKKELAKNKQLEFLWRQPWDKSGETEIFAHMMPFYSYDAPHTCGPDPKICCQFDFKRTECPWNISPIPITSNNVAERSAILADQYRKKASLYNNNDVVLIPVGDDFRFLDDQEWKVQIDNYALLIDYINKHRETTKMHVQIGTLSTYFDLVSRRASSIRFPTLSGDFLTYSDKEKDYWSGYFTSRPWHKALSRLIETRVRSTDILFSAARHSFKADASGKLKMAFRQLFEKLTKARRELALFQHHDATTGTAMDFVMDDYKARLLTSWSNTNLVASASLFYLLSEESSVLELMATSDDKPMVPLAMADHVWMEPFELQFNKLDDFRTAYVFNSLAHPRDHLLTFHLNLSALIPIIQAENQVVSVEVKLNDNAVLAHQLEPVPEQILDANIPSVDGGASHSTVNRFLLRAGPVKLMPLQVVQLVVELKASSGVAGSISIIKPTLVNFQTQLDSPQLYEMNENLENVKSLETDNFIANFNSATGFLKSIVNKKTQSFHSLEINFATYSARGGQEKSGAYLMNPIPQSQPISLDSEPMFRVSRGPLVEEMTAFHKNLEHTIRLHKSDFPSRIAMEVENQIDLSHDEYNDKEFVMVIQSDVQNTDKSFFTDSNCLQMLKRRHLDKLPLQGNVYPMACAAYIEDATHRVTILSRQPLGVVAGLNPGEIRVFLERRLANDDDRGLGQSVQDNVPTRSVFRILVENVEPPEDAHWGLTAEAQFALRDMLNPVNQFVGMKGNEEIKMKNEVSLMAPSGLPCNYELDALKTFYSTSQRLKEFMSTDETQLGLLLHRFSPGCGATDLCSGDDCMCRSSSIDKVNVKTLFPDLGVDSAIKSTLTFIPEVKATYEHLSDVTVSPMNLEGFLLTVKS